MWLQILSISVGATAGALLRWVLSTRAFPSLPLPLGTLSANLLGAYLIGMALAVFAAWPQLSPTWRLLIITGFLGSLTTFSSFSAEMVGLLQGGRWSWAMAGIVAHVAGSLMMTFLGIATVIGVRALLKLA